MNKIKLFSDLQQFSDKFTDNAFKEDMSDFDYCKDAICGMTFEGELYMALNWQGDDDIIAELDAICEKHNVFYELGEAWYCGFYKGEEDGN